MTDSCGLCRSPNLESIYKPQGSGRGLTVYICTHCGLVQSLPRIDNAPRREAAVSSGADWGNVRYGKGFRTEACLAMIKAHTDLRGRLSVLDVGSNRGSFARALLTVAPQAELTCVEPDERVASACANLEGVTLINARIEDTRLPSASFDIVYSCHTLEHLASPAFVMADHWRVLKAGGLLIVDVPNIALTGSEDVLEEWFIDKHLFHFSKTTLMRLLDASGFETVGEPDPNDRENLLFAARKWAVAARPVKRDSKEVDAGLALLSTYLVNRSRNLAVLEDVATEISSLAPERVALWGAGRLFDALVLQGRFNPKLLTLLIDTHLKDHMAERHGVALSGPDAIASADPGVIVVMSRAFSSEIAQAAAKAAPKAEIIFYADLLSRARTRLAA
jgi:SAM-dependent methyltransferase